MWVLLFSIISYAADSSCPNEHMEADIIKATNSDKKDTGKKCCVPTTVDWETYNYLGNCDFALDDQKKLSKDKRLSDELKEKEKKEEDLLSLKLKIKSKSATNDELMEYIKLKEDL